MLKKYIRYGILALSFLTLPANFSLADTTDLLNLDDEQLVEVSAGYRFVDTDNNPNRAAEYSYLNDSPTFNLVIKKYETNRKFSLVGDYLGHKDFNFEGGLDTHLFRLRLRSERMYHNLDHIPYSTRVDSPYDTSILGEASVFYSDNDPGKDYGRQITINEVKLRGKLPNYPAHINLSYWRLEKKGDTQLRFVDEGNGCGDARGCHMQSGTRKIDRVTEEITAGFDAHLGPADIAFLQTLREFREKTADQNDPFSFFALGRPAGDYDHDFAPDSKMVESTFKVNLPPSGGFVTAASYTIGKRENKSGGSDVRPVNTETDYQKLAADVTYTPGEKWTVNFRYRMLELDSDGPATQSSNVPLYSYSSFGSQVPVRESIDIDRNNYSATVSYRPSRRLTLKGDYEREDTDRNNTGIRQFLSFNVGAGFQSNPYWDVPSSETTDRFRLSFFSRHLERSALKFNGWYEHKNVDNPAYGNSLSSSDEFFFNASYKPSSIWGATGSIDILRGENDDRTYTQFQDPRFALNEIQVPYNLDRDEERENLAVGLWFIPNSIVSADLNYGMLHSKIDQDTLYGYGPADAGFPDVPTDFSVLDQGSDFEQRVHTLSAGVNLRILENVNCRVEGYHIRSKSEFTPGLSEDDAPVPSIVNPGELKDISEVDIRQNGFKSRITWQFTRMLRAQFEYTYDDYDDQNSDVFDGSAQTFIASLGGTF